MDNVRRIGLKPVPDDADIANFLHKTMEEYNEKFNDTKKELEDTLEQTIIEGEPPIFAFGKMLNYLATLEKPELIELLAGCMWKQVWP